MPSFRSSGFPQVGYRCQLMNLASVQAALGKADRVKAQISGLGAEIDAFFKAHPYQVLTEPDPGDGRIVYRYSISGDIPPIVPIMVGETLHNLRSALDQVACALALQESGSTKGTYFPFGMNETIFKEQLIKKGSKLPAEARKMIAGLKPYPKGNGLLWAIHDLNRRDKHIEVVTTTMAPGLSLRWMRVEPGPQVLTVGPRKGHHFEVRNGDLVAPNDGARPTFLGGDDDPRAYFSDFGADEDFEFLTAEPGANLKADFEPSFTLALRDVPGFEREYVVTTLGKMRDLVEGILRSFQSRFFTPVP